MNYTEEECARTDIARDDAKDAAVQPPKGDPGEWSREEAEAEITRLRARVTVLEGHADNNRLLLEQAVGPLKDYRSLEDRAVKLLESVTDGCKCDRCKCVDSLLAAIEKRIEQAGESK